MVKNLFKLFVQELQIIKTCGPTQIEISFSKYIKLIYFKIKYCRFINIFSFSYLISYRTLYRVSRMTYAGLTQKLDQGNLKTAAKSLSRNYADQWSAGSR